MLRKLLLFAALPVILYSCDKEDDINTGLRAPTCEDTTDDGVFEKFNSPETARFLKFYDEIPEGEDTAGLYYQFLTSRRIVNTANDLEPALIYRQKRPVTLWAYLAYGENQFYSWTHESLLPADSVNIAISNARNLELTPGCYRLYYVFSDTGYGKVYTKGHYDIEVRKF